MKIYILKSNRLTEAEKDIIKQVIANIQRDESVALKINVINHKTDKWLKQIYYENSSNNIIN